MCRNNKTKTAGSPRPRRLGPWWLPQGTTRPRQPATRRAPVALPVSLVARSPDATLTNARGCSGRAPGTAGQPAPCHPYPSPSHSWAGRFAGERISAQPSEESSGCGGGTIATSWLRAPRGCPHSVTGQPAEPLPHSKWDDTRDRAQEDGRRHLKREISRARHGLAPSTPQTPQPVVGAGAGELPVAAGAPRHEVLHPRGRGGSALGGSPPDPGASGPGEPLGAGLGEERLWGRLRPRPAVPQARKGIRGTRSFSPRAGARRLLFGPPQRHVLGPGGRGRATSVRRLQEPRPSRSPFSNNSL